MICGEARYDGVVYVMVHNTDDDSRIIYKDLATGGGRVLMRIDSSCCLFDPSGKPIGKVIIDQSRSGTCYVEVVYDENITQTCKVSLEDLHLTGPGYVCLAKLEMLACIARDQQVLNIVRLAADVEYSIPKL